LLVLFPAHAGMSPGARPPTAPGSALPRGRGDVPQASARPACRWSSSPRSRNVPAVPWCRTAADARDAPSAGHRPVVSCWRCLAVAGVCRLAVCFMLWNQLLPCAELGLVHDPPEVSRDRDPGSAAPVCGLAVMTDSHPSPEARVNAGRSIQPEPTGAGATRASVPIPPAIVLPARTDQQTRLIGFGSGTPRPDRCLLRSAGPTLHSRRIAAPSPLWSVPTPEG
jgi:hypothetical protein